MPIDPRAICASHYTALHGMLKNLAAKGNLQGLFIGQILSCKFHQPFRWARDNVTEIQATWVPENVLERQHQ